MGQVHKLQPAHSSGAIAPGPMFERAWAAWPDSGKRRSSRRLAVRAWAMSAAEVGEDKLLKALLRYVEEETDLLSHAGAPGFHRWLYDGRWDYWL